MGNCFKSHSNQSDKRFGLCMTYYCCFSDSDLDEKSENGSDDTPIEEMCDILPFLFGHLRILQRGLTHNMAVIQPSL